MPHPSNPSNQPARETPGSPGLLPWQLGVLGFAAGILALRFPFAAGLSLALLFLFSRPVGLAFGGRAGVAACFLCGWWLAAAQLPAVPESTPQWMLDRKPATVSGRVVRVDTRPGETLRVLLADAEYSLDDGQRGELPGLVLWNWRNATTRPLPGDAARVKMRVRPVRGFANPEGWDTGFYWQRQGVFHRGWTRGKQGKPQVSGDGPGPLERWRGAMRAAVEGGDPQDRGRALLAALVLGERLHLKPDVYAALRDASLSHSLALSGLHLGFAAAMGFGLAWLVGRLRPSVLLRMPRLKLGVLLAVPCAGLYLWLGGASPSLVRAGVMLATWGGFLWFDRERPLVDGLFAAVLVILLASPLALFDLRLQFSAIAVAGIGVLGPYLWRLLPRPDKNAGRWRRLATRSVAWALGVLSVSLCATTALLPLSVWYFGQVAPSLWCNVLWLPVLGLVGVPAGLGGALLATVPGVEWTGRMLLAMDAAVLSWCADAVIALHADGWLPVLTPMRPQWPHILGLYTLAATALCWPRTRSRAVLAAGALGVALLAAPWAVREVSGESDTLRLTLLDVGQGQAVLIETPGGGRTLIDGGGPWSRSFDVGQAVVTPVLAWGRWPHVDRMICTHPDSDHYRGLVHGLGIGAADIYAHNGQWPGGKGGRSLHAAVVRGGVQVETWRAGQRYELAPGIELEVLHPAAGETFNEDNDDSLVLRLTWNGRGMSLICGDVERAGIKAMLARGLVLGAEVLVLPHHGSKTSFSEELYALAAPRVALAGTGYLNYLRLPHKPVRDAMAARGIPLLDTGAYGQVRVSWDAPLSPARVETELGGEVLVDR